MSRADKDAGTEPLLYSSHSVNVFLSYVELKYPGIDLQAVLSHAGIRPEEVADQGHWFRQSQVDLFYDKLLQLTGDDQLARQAGRHLVRSETSGWFRRYAFGFLTMEQVVKRTRLIAARITRSALYEAKFLGPCRVQVVVTPYPGIQERAYQCQNRIGSFESFWLHFNLQLPTIRHDECLFSGGQVCRYDISWENSKVQRQERLRNGLFLSVAVASLASVIAVPALTLSVVAPVTLGLLGLVAIIATNQGRQETLKYIETLGDANARALDQIDNDYQSAQLTREIGQVISQARDIDTTLSLILQSLQTHLQDQRAMLLLLDPDHSGWHYRANFGFSSGAVSRVRNLPMMLDACCPESFATFFRQRLEPLVLDGQNQSPAELLMSAPSLREALEAETLVLCPIAADGDLLGLLLVDHRTSRRPLESSDINRLMSVAPIMGVAICNARLIEAMADHQARLSVQVEDRTSELREALRVAHELAQRAEAANLAKSQFLANMSHEIRTPLIGVLGMNELLLHSGLNDQQQSLATTVQNSGETLLELLNDILDFSKIEAGKLTLEQVSFSLREMVENAVAPLAETALSKGLDLIFELAATSGLTVEGDSRRLRQVLLNLVGNAIKFTPRGEVVLRAELLELTAGAATVRFSVSDTGIGIEATAQQTIFESFSQADNSTSRQYGGSGLGLAIVRQLVTLMGGTLGLRSELGAGSCFWFSLPLRLVSSPELKAAVAVPAGKVLLLTSSAVLAEGLREQLALLEQTLFQVNDLPSAQARLASADGTWSLVLVDLALPQDEAGGDLAELCDGLVGAGERLVLLGSYRDCAAMQDRLSVPVESLYKPVRLVHLTGLLAPVHTAAGELPEVKLRQKRAVSPVRGDRHILLVEDNALNREVVVAMLARFDCQLTSADCGEQALDLWGQKTFDLVLMDCQMPGIDGYETTARLRAAGCRAPIVALTARAQWDDAERCRQAGMDDYLSKPFKQKELLAMVDRWLPGAAALSQEMDTEKGTHGLLL